MTEIEERLASLAELPLGQNRTRQTQLLLDDADLSGDVRLMFAARAELASAANFSGDKDVGLAAIVWMLRAQDRDPSLGDQARLMWQYKWVISTLQNLPTVSLEAMRTALDDFADRCGRLGYGANAVAKLRAAMAKEVGAPEADELDRQWQATVRDELSDCLACDSSERVDWLLEVGRDQDAWTALEPVIGGELRCTEEPHRALAKALGPLRRSGQIRAAHDLHRRGYRLARDNPNFLTQVALHVRHLAATRNFARATAMLERHFGWAETTRIPADRLAYLEAVLAVLESARAAGLEQVPVRAPGVEAGTTDVGRLLVEVGAAAEAIAARYDARNGTDRFARRLRDVRDEARRSTEEPIDAQLTGIAAPPTAVGPDEATVSAAPEETAATQESAAPAGSVAAAAPEPDAPDDEWRAWAVRAWELCRFEDAQSARQLLVDRHQDDEEHVLLPFRRALLSTQLLLGGSDARGELIELAERAEVLGLTAVQARALISLAQASSHRDASDEQDAETVSLLRRALALTGDGQDEDRRARAAAAVRLADLLGAGETETTELRDLAAPALDEFENLGEPAPLVSAGTTWALTLARRGELTEALALLDRLATHVPVLEPSAHAQLAGPVAWWRAQILTDLDRSAEAVRAWVDAASLTSGPVRARALLAAGREHLQAGEPALALPLLEQSGNLLDETPDDSGTGTDSDTDTSQPDPTQRIEVRRMQAIALASIGQTEVAIDLLDAVLEDLPEGWHGTEAAAALLKAAELLEIAGDAEPAAMRIRAARVHLSAAGNDYGLAVADEFLADLLNDPAEAEPLLVEAVAAFRSHEEPLAAGRCLRKQAGTVADQGRLGQGRDLLDEALAELVDDDARTHAERAIAYRIAAAIDLDADELDRAVADARCAFESAQRSGDPEQRYLAELLLADGLERTDRSDEALEVLRAARAALPEGAEGAEHHLDERIEALLTAADQG